MDFTSLPALKQYGPLDGVSDDTLLAEMISAYSRVVESELRVTFSGATYTNQVNRAQIDIDGLLTVFLAVPEATALTALSWKTGKSLTWIDLTAANAEIDNRGHGTVIRALGSDLSAYRGSRVQARLSYTGGWATLADVPADFEMLVRRLVWWAYKKRDAPMEKTAYPEVGVVVIPSAWPPDVLRGLGEYRRPW
jgi:hypothetical protein